MNTRKLWKLMAMLVMAMTSLLLLFLLLGQITVGAAPGKNVTITDLNVDFCVCNGVWVTETVDSTGDVTVFTSLALAPTYPYTPHISYGSNGDLKHAWLSGTTWLSETVNPKVINRGQTSLALVPTYPHTPCISYHSGSVWGVEFCCWDDTTWICDKVEGGYFQGGCGVSLALVPTYPYTPHISYNLSWEVWDVHELRHAYLSGTVWCSGTWERETVDSEGKAGCFSSLALEPTYPYTPHISYAANDDLKHAWLSGTTWLSEPVDSGEYGLRSTSLALDSSGNPHIGYQDFAKLDLKHAWLSGTTWLTETVDREGNVGYSTSLALDSSGNPYISYYDATNGDLRLARFDGTVWITQTVESKGWFGWTSLALDQAGCPHISYYDATNGDLKYAYIPTVPAADFTAWPTTGVAPLTVVFTNTSTCNYTTSLWDFGDGTTSTLGSPTHTYTATGVYTVALTVSGPGGSDTETKPEYIKVDYGIYLPLILRNY